MDAVIALIAVAASFGGAVFVVACALGEMYGAQR
jgi:hypothetical protein